MEDETFIRVNKRLKKLAEYTVKQNHEIDEFVNGIIYQVLPRNRCIICGATENLQEHHYAKHIQLPSGIVPVCQQCHTPITEDQKLWDSRCELPGQPENVRIACMLYGIRDICVRKGQKTGNTLYMVLADSLRDDIAKLLREYDGRS